MEQVAIPEKIAFNYEELKQELLDKVTMYETLVYTEEQIKSAKTDRANLNKMKKALNEERIKREKEYMQPFHAFKIQINEIIEIIDKPMAMIDKQIKEYEESQKQEKKKKIVQYFNDCKHPQWLTMEMIWNDRWMNVSVSMKSIQEVIDFKISTVKNDLTTLSELQEFSFEAIETYKNTLDLNKSIAEGYRLSELQKRKAEQERSKAEQEKVRAEQERIRKEQEKAKAEEQARLVASITKEEVAESAEAYREAANVGGVPMTEELLKQWVSFRAFLSVKDAKELKEFFENRKIDFRRI